MILELADIRIHPGQQSAFDEAIRRGLDTVIANARGFRGYKVNKGIESPERYLLMIFWETLENHTVDFRRADSTAGRRRAAYRLAGTRWIKHLHAEVDALL
ncbi:MAG: antibiotic biosynthesis monooxygenase [Burkholderiaceae bacterium]|nr:antibiotic biosynthesis monooxygenase [Burkholderiaceae bacterium]